MEEKASGIVLSAVNYGESDKILNIFTLEQGVVSAKIKGVKKAGAKLRFSAEPFLPYTPPPRMRSRLTRCSMPQWPPPASF